MKFAFQLDHHHASVVWKERKSIDWVTGIFNAPEILIKPRGTAVIREHVLNKFQSEGWALDVKIDQSVGLTVFAIKNDLAFQLQTGNVSRAPYDLLKLQYLYQTGKIKGAALAVPTKACANIIGDNIANAERISAELDLFFHVITVPILLISFE